MTVPAARAHGLRMRYGRTEVLRRATARESGSRLGERRERRAAQPGY
ncbi:hypothetical protein ACQP1W_10915 [Spirillospora sp. CA-255316]